MEETTELWRPVAHAELQLVKASGWRRWPPRLPEQPIFYPVLNREYALEITKRWNVPQYGAGYVTRFRVRSSFLAPYKIEVVGARYHQEYWIPAEKLEELNDAIVGQIEVTDSFE